jgi:hypothetical protein
MDTQLADDLTPQLRRERIQREVERARQIHLAVKKAINRSRAARRHAESPGIT